MDILTNYIKTAFRIFYRNKVYVAINLLSLAFALACCIWSYLNYSFRESFNSNYINTESIYRINSLRDVENNPQPWAVVPLPLAEASVSQSSGNQQVARLHQQKTVVKKEGNVLNETIHFADPELFSFFTFPLKFGNFSSFKGKTVIISEALSLKYFSGQLPVGQEIKVLNREGKEEVYTVGAVLQKIPENSSFQFDIVASFDNLYTSGSIERNNWHSPAFITTFVKVKENSSLTQVEAGLNNYRQLHNERSEDWKIKSFYLQPFRNIAYSSDRDFAGFVYGSPLNANPRGVVVIVPAIMSFFILLITCFNFTNITIAFSSQRLKEIGIRKVMGGKRSQLIQQFICESMIMCFLASLLAVGLLQLLLPVLNNMSGLQLQLPSVTDLSSWTIVLILPILAAVLSGVYPAVYFSSFQPVKVLKGSPVINSSNRFTRFLLTAQFSISCLALIVGIILTQNATYQEKVSHGYDLEKIAVARIENQGQFTALKNKVSQYPMIESVAGTVQHIGSDSYQIIATKDSREVKAQMAHIGGESYMKTMGVRLLEGRHFHAGKGTDTEESVIINQKLTETLNLKNPLGEQIKVEENYFTIIGVVEDYKEFGLHGEVPPCILRLAKPEDYKLMVVRANKEDLAQVNQYLQMVWGEIAPGDPYSGFFQTEVIAKEKYVNEGFKLVAFFLATVTIMLSASGLFALVSLNVIRRSKEIGIRKVLGASVWQLITLINRDFIRLMLIAFTIGSLLAYLLINNLVFKYIYAYHSEVGPLAFIFTFLLIVLSYVSTVGIKVFNAATANPIRALHNE